MRQYPCPDCNWTITLFEANETHLGARPDFAAEAQEHLEVHKDRTRRFKQLGHRPASKPERDALLEAGQAAMNSSDPAMQEQGAEQIIDSGFAYSLKPLMDADEIFEHPTREEYARRLDLVFHFGQELGARLRRKYGPWSGPYIDTWSMQWSR